MEGKKKGTRSRTYLICTDPTSAEKTGKMESWKTSLNSTLSLAICANEAASPPPALDSPIATFFTSIPSIPSVKERRKKNN